MDEENVLHRAKSYRDVLKNSMSYICVRVCYVLDEFMKNVLDEIHDKSANNHRHDSRYFELENINFCCSDRRHVC